MKEPVEIRLAEDRDFAALAKIHAAVFTPRWDAKALREFSSAPGTDTLSASVENILAGFVMARSVLDEAEILTIAVKPDNQRQGLGQALLIEAGARAHRRGATRMFLEVGAENTAALRLYEKLGFVRIGWRKSYYTTANETASQNAASMRGILPFPSKSLGKAP